MAGVLTPEQRDAVNRMYGSEANAIDEVVFRRSEELARLWEDGQSPILWPNRRDFLELWWKRALPVLGIVDAVPPSPPDRKGAPGRPGITVTADTLFELFRQSLERARSTSRPKEPSYEKIASDNGVKRTWVTPHVKWVEKHQREALQAVRLSEIPKRFSTIVRD